jgi:hypothetical protein
LILSGDHGLLPLVNRERAAVRGHMAFSIPNGYVALVVIGIHVDPVIARRADRESRIRRVDLDILFHRADAHGQATFGKFYLSVPVIEVQKLKRSAGTQAKLGLRNLYLGPRALVREQLISDRKGSISRGLHPVIHAARLERNISADVAQPSRERRRVLRHRCSAKEHRQPKQALCHCPPPAGCDVQLLCRISSAGIKLLE